MFCLAKLPDLNYLSKLSRALLCVWLALHVELVWQVAEVAPRLALCSTAPAKMERLL